MAGFKNREELLDLLLDDTENVIEEIVKNATLGEGFTVKDLGSIRALHKKITNYRSMNPKTMQVKVILVDEVPEKCENCVFGHKKLSEDDEPCDLLSSGVINSNNCPLMTEKEYFGSND